MNRILIFLFFVLSTTVFAESYDYVRKVQAHLLIGNFQQAIAIAENELRRMPNDAFAQEILMRAYAAKGEENKLLALYKKFSKQFPEKACDRSILEEIAWTIVKKGSLSSSITIRLASLLGGALTNDAQGMRIIFNNLQEKNYILRALAVELTTYYGDQPLKQEIKRLFFEQQPSEMRLKIIKAIGSLHIDELQPNLFALIENDRSSLEEKIAAISAIASMREGMEREEIAVLARGRRAGLRLLACEGVARFYLHDNIDLIIPLIDDQRPEVRAAALKTIGLLGIKTFNGQSIEVYISNALKSCDPIVGITAAWVLLLNNQTNGEVALEKWLGHPHCDVAALAASALAIGGDHAKRLAEKTLHQHQDPFVKANAAVALICSHHNLEQACSYLFQFVQESKEPWMKANEINGIFSPICLSTLKHKSSIPNYPEVANQTVRLEVLNMLAIVEFPQAQIAIKQFLQERHVGITELAAEVLLGEGDQSALEIVRELLKDPDRHIRQQAALVLAVWGHDHSAIPTLIETYPKSDRLIKIKILECLCRTGSPEALPFLIERLSEDSQILRILGASALIQTLNH